MTPLQKASKIAVLTLQVRLNIYHILDRGLPPEDVAKVLRELADNVEKGENL